MAIGKRACLSGMQLSRQDVVAVRDGHQKLQRVDAQVQERSEAPSQAQVGAEELGSSSWYSPRDSLVAERAGHNPRRFGPPENLLGDDHDREDRHLEVRVKVLAPLGFSCGNSCRAAACQAPGEQPPR